MFHLEEFKNKGKLPSYLWLKCVFRWISEASAQTSGFHKHAICVKEDIHTLSTNEM